jgi:uncharacterized SAM-binding protein YcdF (DUF218 family)
MMMRLIRLALRITAVLALLWLAGLAWFIHDTIQAPDPNVSADGIVAFTGGAERVETALKLLAERRGGLLLLSGVGGGAELQALARGSGIDTAPLAAQVTLGRHATTTHGNAEETEDWARAHQLHSLLVVTGSYHMPRALTELHRVLPDVTLYPVPVLPPALRDPGGLAHAGTLRLLAEEYTKWLAASAGITHRGWPAAG